MLRAQTLIVVGAGASCEAGLPTSEELKATIASDLEIKFELGGQHSGSHEIVEALQEIVRKPLTSFFDINPLRKICVEISESMPMARSIDAFVDEDGRREVALCGKLAIARAILEAERNCFLNYRVHEGEKFKHGKIERTWYNYLAQLLRVGLTRAEIPNIFSRVSFLVFNYDRCIEQFFFHSLRDYYRMSDEAAADIMQSLVLLHPYGSLGSLPWQSAPDSIPFGASSKGRLVKVAENIRTFSERLDEAQQLAEMRHLVRNAETILFLGFAFHAPNLRLLRPAPHSSASRVLGTRHGISVTNANVLETALKTLAPTSKPQLHDLRCAEFFQQASGSFTEVW